MNEFKNHNEDIDNNVINEERTIKKRNEFWKRPQFWISFSLAIIIFFRRFFDFKDIYAIVVLLTLFIIQAIFTFSEYKKKNNKFYQLLVMLDFIFIAIAIYAIYNYFN